MPIRADELKASILAQNPSDEQKAAIFADEVEFLLRATPGSGKTWTSCRRFLWRLEQWTDLDGGLALLSFTNTAVNEFERASVSAGRGHSTKNAHFVGTFDSFVEKFIITPFGHLILKKSKRPRLHLGPKPGERNNTKLNAWVTYANGKSSPVHAWDIVPFMDGDEVAFREANTDVRIDQAQGLRAVEALLETGYYTHDLRNFWACHLLEENPRLAEIVAKRFPELIVDEAQDTTVWLIYLLKLLKKAGAKVTLVGDPDQCIYEFSTASSKSITDLKKEWGLVEKPLNKSFRCNDLIATAARKIGGNVNFVGCGAPKNEHSQAYVIGDASDSYARALASFKEKATSAGILETDCTILCRGHEQVAKVRGTARYLDLKGKTKRLAEAAFLRDKREDFHGAYKFTESVIRDLADAPEVWNIVDEQPDSEEAFALKLSIWKYVRSTDGLPPISLNATAWIGQARAGMSKLMKELGVKDVPRLGTTFKNNGIKQAQMELSLFEEQALFPAIKYETIHRVKGESIDGVFVTGSKKFFNNVVANVTDAVESEDRRLAYVAMTRARHLLVVALDPAHLKKHKAFWTGCGFTVID
jgi:superfamily I DNA/RNA helicase